MMIGSVNGVSSSLYSAISSQLSPVAGAGAIGSSASDSKQQSRQDSGLTKSYEEIEVSLRDYEKAQATKSAEMRYQALGKGYMGRKARAEDKSEKNPDDKNKSLAESLTEEEKKLVQEMQARDQEVRSHEQAHVAVAGSLAKGGASLGMEKGPDGRMYATSGEVQIDTSSVEGDPQATIAKARTVRAAAMAPANPSAQDQQVAAAASKMMAEAQIEKRKENTEEEQGIGFKAENAKNTENAEKVGNSSFSSRLPSAEKVTAVYQKMSGEQGLGLWGSGVNFAV